jgi:hypothetical protein
LSILEWLHAEKKMAKKRARISDGATFEEGQALILKLTRQLRALNAA